MCTVYVCYMYTGIETVMTVDPATLGFHRVVEMHPPKITEPYDPVELGESGVASLTGGKVVTGGVGMTCINAHPHSRLVSDIVYYELQLFEAIAHIASLSGRVFDDSCYPLRLVEGYVDRLGYTQQTLLVSDLTESTAGMEIEPVETQLLATAHLVYKSGARFSQPICLRVTEIDEIAIVRQYLGRREAVLGAILLEQSYGSIAQRSLNL